MSEAASTNMAGQSSDKMSPFFVTNKDNRVVHQEKRIIETLLEESMYKETELEKLLDTFVRAGL